MNPDYETASSRRMPSLLDLNTQGSTKKRRVEEPIFPGSLLMDEAEDFTDRVDADARAEWCCMYCKLVLDLDWVATPCNHNLHTRCSIAWKLSPHMKKRCMQNGCSADISECIEKTAMFELRRSLMPSANKPAEDLPARHTRHASDNTNTGSDGGDFSSSITSDTSAALGPDNDIDAAVSSRLRPRPRWNMETQRLESSKGGLIGFNPAYRAMSLSTSVQQVGTPVEPLRDSISKDSEHQNAGEEARNADGDLSRPDNHTRENLQERNAELARKQCVDCCDMDISSVIVQALCQHHFHVSCLERRVSEYLKVPEDRLLNCCGLRANLPGEPVCTEDITEVIRAAVKVSKLNQQTNVLENGSYHVQCARCGRVKPDFGNDLGLIYYGECMHPYCTACVKTAARDLRRGFRCKLCDCDLTYMLSEWSDLQQTPPELVRPVPEDCPTAPNELGVEETSNKEPALVTKPFTNELSSDDSQSSSITDTGLDNYGVVRYLRQHGMDTDEIPSHLPFLEELVAQYGIQVEDFSKLTSTNVTIGELVTRMKTLADDVHSRFTFEACLTSLRWMQEHASLTHLTSPSSNMVTSSTVEDEKELYLICKNYHKSDAVAHIARLIKFASLMELSEIIERRPVKNKKGNKESKNSIYKKILEVDEKVVKSRKEIPEQARKDAIQTRKSFGTKLTQAFEGIGGKEVLMFLPLHVTETYLANKWHKGSAQFVNLLMRRNNILYSQLQQLGIICKPHFEAIHRCDPNSQQILDQILETARTLHTIDRPEILHYVENVEFAPRQVSTRNVTIDKESVLSLRSGQSISPQLMTALLRLELDKLDNGLNEAKVTITDVSTIALPRNNQYEVSESALKLIKKNTQLLIPIFISESTVTSAESWFVALYTAITDEQEENYLEVFCPSGHAQEAQATSKWLAQYIKEALALDELKYATPRELQRCPPEEHGILILECALRIIRSESISNPMNFEACRDDSLRTIFAAMGYKVEDHDWRIPELVEADGG